MTIHTSTDFSTAASTSTKDSSASRRCSAPVLPELPEVVPGRNMDNRDSEGATENPCFPFVWK